MTGNNMVTILGSGGFIGSALVKELKARGMEYYAPARGEQLSGSLGHVIYCIGLTADFRYKPFDTVEAHVCVLNGILKNAEFESLTYLSSTRVYINSTKKEVTENEPINITVTDPDELYTLTKLTGERLCLSSGRKTRIVRLSNVYGTDYDSENFINDIIGKIKKEGRVDFFTTAASAKDYISLDALTAILITIATTGKQDIYNVASGENISNAEIIEMLKQYFSFEYMYSEKAREILFPAINIDRIKNEFGFSTQDNKQNLLQLIKMYSND
jgi:nucleoside-diphosphate-sugar epimerase